MTSSRSVTGSARRTSGLQAEFGEQPADVGDEDHDPEHAERPGAQPARDDDAAAERHELQDALAEQEHPDTPAGALVQVLHPA